MINRFKTFLILFLNLVLISYERRDLRVIEEAQPKEETQIRPPGFSRVSGFYPQNFKLKLSSEENTKIYYTLDSSDPKTSPTSQEFKDYILIYDRSLEPNIFSSYGEDDDSPISISRGHKYKGVQHLVDKAMIVRAVSKNEKGEFSQVISKTYFVTNEDLYKYEDTTVISLVTDPENLFSPDFGIYVTGTMYQEWKNSDEYDPKQKLWDKNSKCNFFMKGAEWEREAFLTIFDKGEMILQQNVGIRVKGGATRNYPAKSFNIYARKKYGKSRIEADILNDNYDINGNLITSYKGLSVRSVYDNSRIRDIIGRDIFYSRKGLTFTNMKFSVLFLNGEYWGLYILQERLSDDFIEKNYLIPSDNVVLAKDNEIEDGPEEEYTKFKEFCIEYSKKDLTDEKIYEEIKNFIDINSLIELFATGIYIGNNDWPGKNDGMWKNIGEKLEGNEYSDGKWRFLIYDLDYSMNSYSVSTDSFKHAQSRVNRAEINSLFLSLLENNTDFQKRFVNIYCDYANEVYSPQKVKKILEKYRDNYIELVPNTLLRWGRSNFDSKLEGFANCKSKYLNDIDSIINFYENRPNYTLQHMKDFIGLKGDVIDLTIEIKGKGNVQINSIIPDVSNGKWTGKYFSRIPIKIKAIPQVGYYFKKWGGYIESTQQSDEIILFESQTIIAYFD